MTISLVDARRIRDILHNLDLSIPEHQEIYENLSFEFISYNETIQGKPDLEVYDDGKGFATIGYGFNMDAKGARDIWQAAIGREVSFDEARSGRIKLTEEQSFKLFKYVKDQNLKKLQAI